MEKFTITSDKMALSNQKSYGMRITQDNGVNIQVIALSTGDSCGGFKVMPARALGKEYYAVTSHGQADRRFNHYSQIGVVSAENNVEVSFWMPPGVSIVYNGALYEGSRRISVMLNQMQAFLLEYQVL